MTGHFSVPGFDKLYSITTDGNDDSFHADLPDFAEHTRLLRAEWTPESVLDARWTMGKPQPGEIAVGRSTGWIYLGDKIRKLFRENHITGWAEYPIALYDKAGMHWPGYCGFSITGRCGAIDKQSGEIAPRQKPGKKFVLRIGLYFDVTTWDGKDFFCPHGTNTYKFATDRVKNLFHRERINGFRFTPLTEEMWYP